MQKDLLRAVARAVKAERDRKLKFQKRSVKVNEISQPEDDDDVVMLDDNASVTKALIAEVRSFRGDLAKMNNKFEQLKPRFVDRTDKPMPFDSTRKSDDEDGAPRQVRFDLEYGCPECKKKGTQKTCTHCFRCCGGDHKGFECPDRPSNLKRSQLGTKL